MLFAARSQAHCHGKTASLDATWYYSSPECKQDQERVDHKHPSPAGPFLLLFITLRWIKHGPLSAGALEDVTDWSLAGR